MNEIKIIPIEKLGYDFVSGEYLEEGNNEFQLRQIQYTPPHEMRQLTAAEISTLVRNNNVSDNWQNIFVTNQFNPNLVKNNELYGLIRIGHLQPACKEFHDFRMTVGIYHSKIISCDFGDNVCIENVKYLSHYIIGDDVMIANVKEMATTNHAKFGNGIIKKGEADDSRVQVEVRNENGGRPIHPFNRMLAGDAYLWSEYRTDKKLLEQFKLFTENTLDDKRGYYGKIGDRTIIKNCGIIKDVWIGSDAYLKGANKLKNLTINSDADRKSQIGEGCELVNGIIGFGCRIFYGVKAVRFVLSSHCQLKYGARLINSFLGPNSTISCCEVLNSLIFGSHEQHHNNSFLCASMVMGQSNMAAGATIGSNHNSRAADGEIIAGRGFWPGLCVSLKHNSKFASFTIIAKADYPNELFIPIPFSLVHLDEEKNSVSVMPAYWFMYNMYALERNSEKLKARDKRSEKIQCIEFDYLAPDTVNEIFSAIEILEKLKPDEKGNYWVEGWENSKRKVQILKVEKSLEAYRTAIFMYGMEQFIKHFQKNSSLEFNEIKEKIPTTVSRSEWKNIGGQLIEINDLKKLFKDIKSNEIGSWDDLHHTYHSLGDKYESDKLQHAFTSLLEIKNITSKQFSFDLFQEYLNEYLKIKTEWVKNIYDSREKDYNNKFRQMVYNSTEEMNEVIGKIENNSFIQNQFKQLEELKTEIAKIKQTNSINI